MQIDAVACRMGRASLDWTQEKLADEANLSTGVIGDYECGRSTLHRNHLTAILRAFENAGIEFLVHGTRVLVLPR